MDSMTAAEIVMVVWLGIVSLAVVLVWAAVIALAERITALEARRRKPRAAPATSTPS